MSGHDQSPAAAEPGADDLLSDETPMAAWARHVADAPGRPCVRMATDAQWLTHGELEARSRSAARRLAGTGLRPGDRILLSAAASVELVVAYVAALRLGLTVVPANTAYTRRELDHIVDDADPAAAIVDDPARGAYLTTTRIVCGPELALGEEADVALDRATRDELALIAYTSGTTGAPKGAMLSCGNLLASAQAVRLAWRWSASDRLVLTLPLFHLHGLGVGVNGTLVAGASMVLLPRFGVDDVLDAVRDHQATLYFGVPTMYARLAASERVGELRHLRLCVSGSAPLDATLHAEFAARTGQRILERYGMTETLMNSSNPLEGERRAGTVGRPLPGVEIRFGPDGEILIRGPNVFRGYWRRPDATAEAFTSEGWFRTGDIGQADADGYVRIVGRSKEMIISGGYNVYPREVEDVLRAHPAVTEVAVAGLASTEWGETVGAWVVARRTLDPDELIAFARERLAPFKCPRSVQLVDSLPRNALGKVLRRQLSELR